MGSRTFARLLSTYLLGIWVTLAAAQGLADCEPGCGHAKAAMARLLAGLHPDGNGGPRTGGETTDLLHNALDIEIIPATSSLAGSNTMTLKSRVDGLTTFQFQLDSGLPIGAVRVSGTPASWTRLDPVNVQVTLDRPYNTNEVFTVYVAYSGRPVNGAGLGSITFRTRNGAPDVYTLSEPWFAYTWWPCKNDLTDKSTGDMWFTVPDTLVVGSNGALQGVDTIVPGKLRYRWRTNYQMEDYLYSFGATNYHQFGSTWQYQGHTMPLSFFIYPEDDSPGNQAGWLSIGQTLTTYSDLFGIYPFVDEKYGMLEFGWGGGMEHQTLTSILGYFWWESGIVHECSHQWWGDNVTCATWKDIWLNEGFADYCEALWYQYKPGSSGEPALHSAMADRRPGNVNGSVYCYNDTDVGRIFNYDLSYLKGGWVLHMLRHVIGDTNFFNTLAAYRATYQGNSATTDEFRAVAEAVSGRNLGWFFTPWVYGIGAPAYQYAWQQYLLDGNRYVEVYVKQVQSPQYPLFPMPVDIQTTNTNGSQTYVIWNDQPAEHLLFGVQNPAVTTLQFDPKPWILWTNLSTISFVQGPPKIVTITPPPGAVVKWPHTGQVEVVFHKDVVAQGSRFTLVGAQSGPASFTFSYDAPRHAAKLTPTAPLVPDTYTLTAADTIVDVAAGLKLDGELMKGPTDPSSLPSGNGLPGGPAVEQFTVVPALGDLNCDGAVDFGDIDPFVLALTSQAAYQAQYPNCDWALADINQDGSVDFGDIDPFVVLLGG